MNTSRSILGDCPRCEAEIPARSLLIEYETADGTSSYAECPECEAVVTPQ
jgi:uncharacterized C2H2 Zn-finger protein